MTRSTSSRVVWLAIGCPVLTTTTTPPSGLIPVAASSRFAADVDCADGSLNPPPWSSPATGPPNTPQIAANAIPEMATRHGWREIVRERASNIGGLSFFFQALGGLCVEVGAPRVQADPEVQDLHAHRAGRIEMGRFVGGEAACGVAVAAGHAARQLDALCRANRVGEEELQEHLVAKLDRGDGRVRD